MNTETQVVESAPSTENAGAVVAEQTPEVAKPEPTEGADPPKAQEKTPEQKEAEARQRRITKLERTNARLYMESEQYRQRLEALEKAVPKQEAEKVEVDQDEFDRAVQTRSQAIARAERLNERCNQVVSKGEEQFPDFTASVKALSTEMPLFQRDGSPTAALEVILEADNPPALLHHLGKNPDLVDQLADLTPTQLARRLDRIERDMTKPAVEQKSSAPRPLEPVKAAAAPSVPDPKDTKAWIAWRNKTSKI